MRILAALIFLAILDINRGLAYGAPASLALQRATEIDSEYFAMDLNEYAFDPATALSLATGAVGGGAFTENDGKIVYVSSNGKSFLLDLQSLTVTPNFLPTFNLGATAFERKKHINYFETTPRVHDVVMVDSIYYLTYDYFSEDDDSIHFTLASLAPGSAKWKVLWQSGPVTVEGYTLENGGAMQVFDNKLYFSVGDFSMDEVGLPAAAQDPLNSSARSWCMT